VSGHKFKIGQLVYYLTAKPLRAFHSAVAARKRSIPVSHQER
jgi:hypothetical protein